MRNVGRTSVRRAQGVKLTFTEDGQPIRISMQEVNYMRDRWERERRDEKRRVLLWCVLCFFAGVVSMVLAQMHW